MRRKRSLVALLIVLALLAGTYIYLTNRPEEPPEQVETKPVVYISQVDREEIVKVTLENENVHEKLIFEMKTQELGSDDEDEEAKTETVWMSTKPYPVELVQSKVIDLVRSFSTLPAEIIVEENPQDLSVYGLDKPVATGTASLKDGTKVTLNLGNKTADGITWYLMKEGDTKVYTVGNQHGQRLYSTLSDFRDKSLPSVDLATLTYLSISGKGRREIEIVTNKDLSEEQAAYGISILSMTKPFKRAKGVDSTRLGDKLGSMPTFAIKEFVDDHPSDYKQYGLDEPSLRFIIKDQEDNMLDLSFGNRRDDGTIYFQTQDSDAVYIMDASQLEFLNFEPFELIDKFALLLNINDVDRLTMEGRGRTHTFSITRTTVEAEEEEDEVIATYFMDGKEIEEEAFKSIYQSIIGILVDTEKAHTAEGTPEWKVTYETNKNGDKNPIVELYPYDQDFYSLVLDGDMESEFLIYRKRLDWVFNDLDDLIAGKTDEE